MNEVNRNIPKKPSGAAGRKRAKEKEEKRSSLIKKIPKLDSYFINETVMKQPDCDEEPVPSTSSSPLAPSASPPPSPLPPLAELNTSDEPASSKLSTFIPSDDPATWEVTEELRDFITRNGIKQNDEADFSKSERQYANQKRFLSKTYFLKKLTNGETVKRGWLVYSISTGRVFCAPCKLYADRGATALATSGFNDWKNGHIICDHDNSPEHRKCLATYASRGKLLGRVDTQLIIQYQEEVSYWRNVLQRVVEAVKFLASRGLPFHGENETIGNVKNGNFLGCIELISKFDPFMADHLARYGNKGSGIPSYLSSTIVDEFIIQISDQVKNEIIAEVKNAKYYSIIVESTPDVSHINQLVFVIRYVLKDGTPVERFVTFLPNCGHKGEDIEKAVLFVLESLQLNLSDCRGQSYDNASNMSGAYKGLQSRIKELNPLATYIPCAGHSLQLVGSAAVESSTESVAFFALEQQLYNFFSSSTHRWEILLSKLEKGSPVLKTLSRTRWSARADSSKALYTSYHEVVLALEEICNDQLQPKDVKLEAKSMVDKIKLLEMTILICFWNIILIKFQEMSEKIQGVDMDLPRVVYLYSTLLSFLNMLRNEKEFDRIENDAIKMCGSDVYKKDIKRKKKPKVAFGESNENHTELNGKLHFIVEVYYAAIDCLKLNLENRLENYRQLNEKFGFLWNLHKMTNDDIRIQSKKLREQYNEDLEDVFPEECVHLAQFLRDSFVEQKKLNPSNSWCF